MESNFDELEKKVITCIQCPRLVNFRKAVEARAPFKDETYWRRPLPGFGDPNARVLVLGLAPSPHGGNRTGRIFTGDPSACFLMRGLYEEGFANQPSSESIADGLILQDCYITAAVKCVPPGHHPSSEEFLNCSCYFENELFLLSKVKAILALGKLAFDAYLHFLKKRGVLGTFPRFSHGSVHRVAGWPTLYGSYHPSPQNTNTGLMTAAMFRKVLQQIKQDL